MPDLLLLERRLWAMGKDDVAGVDEAGRGALFGPVVAAAVILDPARDLTPYRDSKALSASQRERAFARLAQDGHTWSVAEISAEEIDAGNILRATLKAMALALSRLPRPPAHVLVDGPRAPEVTYPVEAVVHGDAVSASIAAASIVAKVHRDRLVMALDSEYPGYGLAKHKGYGTEAHLEAIRRLGPSPLHRRSFRGVEGMS
jgi:ribonuclease HII